MLDHHSDGWLEILLGVLTRTNVIFVDDELYLKDRLKLKRYSIGMKIVVLQKHMNTDGAKATTKSSAFLFSRSEESIG